MKKIITEKSSIRLIILGVIFIIISLIFFLWNNLSFSLTSSIDNEKFSHFGDFIGGIVGSLWALAGVFLFYVALKD